MIKYSVIIPLYNKGWRIKRAIDSVLRQGNNDLEIIVVDDGSTDDSADYVKAYHDECIRYIYKKNGGVSSARNRGLLESKGYWLLFLDADDEMLEGALGIYEKMANRYPESRFFVGRNSNSTQKERNGTFCNTRYPFLHIWLNKVYPASSNMMIARTLFLQSGNYNEQLSFYEDFDLTRRVCHYGSLTYTYQATWIYHQEKGGGSSSFHPLNREMAYYIPEILAKGNTTFWERALLYDNIEQEIAVWQGNEENIQFYRDMQLKHFAWYYKHLHWLRQQLKRHGII